MSLSFHWFLPTYGDSRGLIAGGHGTAMSGDRPASLRYLNQIGAAAEDNGFEAVLTPTGAWCEDAWLTTAMLVETTETLKFLVAFRPGLISPTLAAQMAGTFQRHSRGRLLLNVVTGGEPHEQQAYGDFLDKTQRYARTGEFLDVVRQLWTSTEPVSFDGEHIQVREALLNNRPDPVPPIFFGGSSEPAGPVAARYADTYLTWGEPLLAVRRKLEWIRGLAAERGRTLDFGLRIHVISRDTSEEAWAEADRLLAGIDPADVERVQANLARSESEGQRRMLELHGGRTDRLEIAPNLWAGVGLVRGGAGTALVGSHAEVAERIAEYARLGIDHFILSGYPHLEEAYWFGEGVLPILERKGLWRHPHRREFASTGTPFAASSSS
ncbi:LLM class flavin-dependent oxidoreductase [Nocardia cyriacigeorgica]|jgi:alkanesulfonate monooxygenase|uniref:Alkanesulfonate monooxygenase n=1 Tax=Nocardia cyriacigeorgica TaxID=135487 RepID=A0A4U8VX70_9NOCA|nr:LLM class flavin-dependent oxidoreductase [Nocardia cyriacigeorgica]MBF6096557.1 LLM class flavin-dependent oxidoreductase [Nocardia cyriacigeorgica]MBF6162575.1 LLM class flavin-dependent oxidoreductase [Nocardia cyriacigeorgica]MBF6201441.1 LLM class flavin-dependent oxidoreductase [Nocardia cyriacigeorgica]MBF6317143.1 LLM class flavin-dependent oxidoreductase [Nocardia cyriacigeorgica]MBF6345211.1 LLM class flavin-dependent oxidoreductase [Nocardia cyriacigeorgica]